MAQQPATEDQQPHPLRDFKEYQNALFAALTGATRAANAIPISDLGYYRSLDRDFAKTLDSCSEKVLKLSNNMLKYASVDEPESSQRFHDVDDVLDRYGVAIDVVDNLLEKADVGLDDLRGQRNRTEPVMNQTDPVVAQVATKGKSEYKMLHAQNIIRPQLRFKDTIDNSSNTPFIPKLTFKPNSKAPLDPNIAELASKVASKNFKMDETMGAKPLSHPYEHEIKHIEYPDQLFAEKSEQLYLPFEDTQATWVDNEETLKEMCSKLEAATEIAIDLEHHDYRSFQGFVCLMQISTRDEDFIVDTLEVRDKLWMLNTAFTNPNIIKVMHGATSDIIWLQRDFGVYVVDLFDTYHASKTLELPSHGLAYLLKHYCDVDADKKYQLADWRIRPLPTEMLKYARSDTHYLLYIFDRMRRELLERGNVNHNLIRQVLGNSEETSLRKHEKDVYDAEHGEGFNGWRNLLSKWKTAINAQQFAVFKGIHAWRDQTARDEDESVRYVLPNHMIFSLLDKMPTDSTGVIGCCNPCPPLVRMHAHDIALVIQRAKMAARDKSSIVNLADMPAPRHTRYADQDTEMAEAKQEDRQKLAAKATVKDVDPKLFDLNIVEQQRAQHYQQLAKAESVLFGQSTRIEVSIDLPSKQMADHIRQSLRLSVPGIEDAILRTEGVHEVKLPESPKEHLFTNQSERVTKQEPAAAPKAKDSDVIVLKETTKKRTRAEEIQEEDSESATSGSSAQPTDDDEKAREKEVKKARKKARKANQKAQRMNQANEEIQAVQTFDYDSAKLEHEANPSSSSKKKRPAVFNPYGQIVDAKFKKQPKVASATKKADRAMTFKK
ncbi:exosome nuclease subunit [Umbelopsis sp. WA50703]